MFSPSALKPVTQFVAYCKAQCEAGFDNHFHWTNWMKKWRGEIGLLNETDRDAILAAHENATWNGKLRPGEQADAP